jgi:hypothetical protein
MAQLRLRCHAQIFISQLVENCAFCAVTGVLALVESQLPDSRLGSSEEIGTASC